MQATAQQAIRWRWLSPHGLQAVAFASSPAFSRAGATAATAHRAAVPANQGPHSSPAAMGCSHQPLRPCLGCRVGSSGFTNGSCICTPRVAGGAVSTAIARRRPSLARRGTLRSFASSAATSTAVVSKPCPRPTTEDAAGTTICGQRHSSPYRPPLDPLAPAASTFTSTSVPTTRTPALGRAAPTPTPTLARAQLRRSPPSAEAVRRVTLAATAVAATGGEPPQGAAGPQLPTRHIVAAVDPDLGGALALIYWDEEPPGAGRSGGGEGEAGGGAVTGSAAAAASGASSRQVPSPSASAWHVADTGGWLLVAPPAAALGGTGAAGRGRSEPRPGAKAAAAVPESVQDDDDDDEEEELQDDGSGGADVDAGDLWLPAPPPPPADVSRWNVRVWDMPISAAERQKRTATGAVSKRRLLHVAGARAAVASALAAALPPPGERRRVALYGYVEVPPILPGDGNISAYTCLWSTGAWLGLLTGMGFTVGSTPVRRWKQDLGLLGARSKDAGLALARLLFPDQACILKHKKNHGRADALLIAAWALGARLPPGLSATLRRNRMTLDQLLLQQPETVGLGWGPPRPPTPSDAYGNLLTPERDLLDEIEATQCKVERLDKERAEAKKNEKKTAKTKTAAKSSRGRTSAAKLVEATSVSDDGGGGGGATPVRRRQRKSKGAATELEATNFGAPQTAVGDNSGGAGETAAAGGGVKRRRRQTKNDIEAAAAPAPAAADEEPAAPAVVRKCRAPRRSLGAVAVAATAAGAGEVAGRVSASTATPAEGPDAGMTATTTKVKRQSRRQGAAVEGDVSVEAPVAGAGAGPGGDAGEVAVKPARQRRRSARGTVGDSGAAQA